MHTALSTHFWQKWSDIQRSLNGDGLGSGLETSVAWRRFFADFFGTAPERHWLFGGRRFRPWFSGQWGAPVQFNPFVAVTMSKGGGLLSLYVLHLLAQEPCYGNDIMRQIASQTQGRWSANPGAIYPLLDSMEEQGFLEGVWEDPRKRTRRVYSLTSAGREELARLRDVIRPKLREAVDVLFDLYEEMGHPADETNHQ